MNYYVCCMAELDRDPEGDEQGEEEEVALTGETASGARCHQRKNEVCWCAHRAGNLRTATGLGRAPAQGIAAAKGVAAGDDAHRARPPLARWCLVRVVATVVWWTKLENGGRKGMTMNLVRLFVC